MKTLQNGRPVAAILSDLASLGPFLPCSIRKGGVQRHRNKAGELVEYMAQPRLNFRIGGKPVDKRIYLCKRKDQMDYGRCRKKGLVIGSGSVETACKLLIGARQAGPGMRWRFQNGLCIAALRAAIRSHLKIAA